MGTYYKSKYLPFKDLKLKPTITCMSDFITFKSKQVIYMYYAISKSNLPM